MVIYLEHYKNFFSKRPTIPSYIEIYWVFYIFSAAIYPISSKSPPFWDIARTIIAYSPKIHICTHLPISVHIKSLIFYSYFTHIFHDVNILHPTVNLSIYAHLRLYAFLNQYAHLGLYTFCPNTYKCIYYTYSYCDNIIIYLILNISEAPHGNRTQIYRKKNT